MMADITNQQAVTFANEKIRTAANRLAQSYNWAREVVDEWTAAGGTSLIPNTSDAVVDGSATDGRPVIDGADCSNIINRLIELIADLEAGGNAKLNTILQVAPHPNG